MSMIERAAMAGCGCGSQGSDGLITVDAALAAIPATIRPLKATEILPLAQAAGRILARPVRARAMTPPFDNCAMDGYAICAASLWGDGPWDLAVRACQPAGSDQAPRVGGGEAVQVFTGAPLPEGADSVIMQEDVTRQGDRIAFARRPAPGAHVRRAGEDMQPGDEVLAAGRSLGPREIAAAAAAGCAQVALRRVPRVALLGTGNELRAAGDDLGPAMIWDVDTPMMEAAIRASGAELVEIARGSDDRAELAATLARLAERADVIVTTGGISVGAADLVKPALEDLGGSVTFSGVAMKPGKPVSLGRLGQAQWLGLPGNPMSAYVTWMLFGPALLDALTGATARPTRRNVVTEAALTHAPGRCELRPARLGGFDGLGRESVLCPPATRSARVSDLARADGLVLLPAEVDGIEAGGMLDFLPFA